MDFDRNPYYHPEAYGLTPVGEVEWTEPCYSFNTTVVWKHTAGHFLVASDSGCSCPSPFELCDVDDLEPMTAHQVATELQIRLQLLKVAEERWGSAGSDLAYVEPQIVDLLAKVMA